jgi:Lrp/AsnC family leucine-responsive transcriptional regulator
MGATVAIDETDTKILNALIKDARARVKDIAKDCGISSVSVINRIKRLKTLSVITGSTLFPNVATLGLPIVATIGVNLNGNQGAEIIKLIEKQTRLIEPATSVGKYDLTALVYAENITELDKIAYALRKTFDVPKVDVNVWASIPHMLFENIDLKPLKGT